MSQKNFDFNNISTASSTVAKGNTSDNLEPSETHIVTVSELNKEIKRCLEGSFTHFWLKGEVSNFTAHSSGHWYFTLKDKKSQISAVMFRGKNSRVKFLPKTGMEIIIRGRVSVYEPRGNYQVFCEDMEPAGIGALQQAYEQLKEKLQKEGLFATSHKKPIPSMPQHIAVVTSPTGAAISDILNVLKRRYRFAKVTVVPAIVQGDKAPAQIVSAIELVQKIKHLDVIIVGRGGGSMEDLWGFNDEQVVRAIYNCPVPIISAVGHEIDFTLSDFAADLRAPTPSAAAELVAKNATELLEKLTQTQKRLTLMVLARLKQFKDSLLSFNKRLVNPRRRLEDLSVRMDELTLRLEKAIANNLREKKLKVNLKRSQLTNPKNRLENSLQKLELINSRLLNGIKLKMSDKKHKLITLNKSLDNLSPLRVVDRGYSITTRNGQVVKSVTQLKTKEEITVRVTDGHITATVNKTVSL